MQMIFLVVVVVAAMRPRHTSAMAWCADSRLFIFCRLATKKKKKTKNFLQMFPKKKKSLNKSHDLKIIDMIECQLKPLQEKLLD